jgi:hypothetical protein
LKIWLLNSSPYYAQTNGHAEASNKALIKLIKKKIDEQPRRWHEVLSEALWAHRVAWHGATKVTPFELVYGQEGVLPIEVNLQACSVAWQNGLSDEEYTTLMMHRIDEGQEERFKVMMEIEKENIQTAKACNRKVKEKSFQVGDLVWKMILPLRTRDNRFGKWSPIWEGPYKVVGIAPWNAYFAKPWRGGNWLKCSMASI